jgi:hypothetical protein
MKTKRIGTDEAGRIGGKMRSWIGAGSIALASSLFVLTLSGCGGGSSPVGPDEMGGRTAAGISVEGAEPALFPAIDGAWAEVTGCWGVAVDGGGVKVSVKTPELTDAAGRGVIRYDGKLVYGARVGNHVYVASDLAALRHEFSHLVGEKATGGPADNGAGRCWL